jgi:hypothetical protein
MRIGGLFILYLLLVVVCYMSGSVYPFLFGVVGLWAKAFRPMPETTATLVY